MINTQKVLEIVRQTREMSYPNWGKVKAVAVKEDTGSGEVTEIDRQIEQFLTQELRAAYPDISFVGEEFGGDMKAQTFWLCDPIDGTAHFIRGLPFCTTMVCLIDNGQVVFSVIYDFINDVAYFAEKGKGAFKTDFTASGPELIHVINRPIALTYVGYESRLNVPGMIEVREKVRERCVLVNTINCGWEFIQVATGKLDGRIQNNPYGYEHDFAPGSLLVAEAGGVVANIGSSEYDYHNLSFLAVTPNVYKGLTDGPDAIFPIKS
jgi:fructose-1,6-bisphosphatase/inositol monophosphatase family enzyme